MKRVACPVCSRGPSDKTCVIFDSGRVHCHRCGKERWREIKDALGHDSPAPAPVVKLEQRYTTLADWARELWYETRPLESTAIAYLEARNCAIPPSDSHLRWHPALKFGDHVGPALVALVTDFATQVPLSLHRTWIRADGSKDGPGRRLLGRHRKRGGVIRLWPDDAVTTGLALAEGIESALSVAHFHRPVWSAIDAGNLADLPIVSGIECLTIYADRDPNGAGEEAARMLGWRWKCAGRVVHARMAQFGDANDVARGNDS